jgi:hypothetical protein
MVVGFSGCPQSGRSEEAKAYVAGGDREVLCVRAALTAPTYIRPGLTRSKVPHARCEGAGSKGDGRSDGALERHATKGLVTG